MAGIVNNKPNLKKTYAGFKRVDDALEAKKTTGNLPIFNGVPP